MSVRPLPVRPDLKQLRHQAKDLLREMRVRDPAATLAQAQHALARGYGVRSWTRLKLAALLTSAIWNDDAPAVRRLVLRNPELLHEDARGVKSSWGPPMSYAANVGADAVIDVLRELGASDVQYAFERAVLQGRIATARRLMAMGARPVPGTVMGPCETLNPDGIAFVLANGGELADATGDPLAPVALLLQTYSRFPDGKHRCLELVARHGVALPDTPPMALHRGRRDLLERHLAGDPALFTRTFSHREIYPRELGCAEDASLALHGTPLAGATLLHMAVDFDELDLARWMLDRGAPADARAAVDADGFGGHTPLFGTVVSQAYRCGRDEDAAFAHLLLDAGANPNARASLRKRLRFTGDDAVHEYRDVTPVTWGERFHDQDWVNPASLEAIRRATRPARR